MIKDTEEKMNLVLQDASISKIFIINPVFEPPHLFSAQVSERERERRGVFKGLWAENDSVVPFGFLF